MRLHDWRVVNNVRLKNIQRFDKATLARIKSTPPNHITVIENPFTCTLNIYLRIGKKAPMLKAIVPRYFYPENSSVLRVSMFLDDLAAPSQRMKFAFRSKKLRTEKQRKKARRRR